MLMIILIMSGQAALAACTNCTAGKHSSCSNWKPWTNYSGTHYKQCCDSVENYYNSPHTGNWNGSSWQTGWVDGQCYKTKCSECTITSSVWQDHNYPLTETVVTAATCTTTGTKKYQCSRAGTHNYTASYGPNGHSWGDWVTVTAATCTAAGSKKRTCTVCGAEETEAIAALGHNWGEWLPMLAATCTEAGQEGRVCSRCGLGETRVGDPALGHSWPSTYTYSVNSHWKYCSRGCGAYTPLEAHSYTSSVTKSATCTEVVTPKYSCTVCTYYYTTDEPAALGHNWSTAWTTNDNQHWHKCTRFTATNDVGNHSWGTGSVTTQPTCTATGVRTFTCTNKSTHTKTETEPALGHNPGSWEDYDDNYHKKFCTRCNVETNSGSHVDSSPVDGLWGYNCVGF